MFDDIVGNERAKELLRRMLRQRRVPGALIFSGASGLGKKLFAVELARALNCQARKSGEGCGVCSACVRMGKFDLPQADDKSDEYKKVRWSGHRDVGMLLPYNRNILVDAVRDLERECNYRPFEGAARVFLIEEAHSLNEAASNALLKTLEEAPPTTHLVLITARPAGLLPTIRSRCQTIHFAPLPREAVEAYLVKNRKRAGEEARLAAHLAGGRLGPALSLNLDAYRAHREWALGALEALASGDNRAHLLRAAEELSDAKNKDDFEPRLDVLATLARDLWLLAVGAGEGLVNQDLRERLARLAEGLAPARPARWLARVEELRTQLALNVNRRAAADALLLSMAAE